MSKHSVQIVKNHLLYPREGQYPNLVKEIKEHDRYSSSSWYDLSDAAYAEYQAYMASSDDEE